MFIRIWFLLGGIIFTGLACWIGVPTCLYDVKQTGKMNFVGKMCLSGLLGVRDFGKSPNDLDEKDGHLFYLVTVRCILYFALVLAYELLSFCITKIVALFSSIKHLSKKLRSNNVLLYFQVLLTHLLNVLKIVVFLKLHNLVYEIPAFNEHANFQCLSAIDNAVYSALGLKTNVLGMIQSIEQFLTPFGKYEEVSNSLNCNDYNFATKSQRMCESSFVYKRVGGALSTRGGFFDEPFATNFFYCNVLARTGIEPPFDYIPVACSLRIHLIEIFYGFATSVILTCIYVYYLLKLIRHLFAPFYFVLKKRLNN
ncbi:hypothetical protein M3Y97_00969400 [Aphelenchoides bicaudatus]|nr:hypothetical protein M3Y97_00969400 [Aphelenchoides bicaudatus]